MRVSVVVPVYNGEATLADCLRALSAQSLPRDDYEVIVVNDGSTDDTTRVAADFQVRVLTQARHGAPAARNAGARAARGEWVAFTDADCIPSRTWLAALLEAVGQADRAAAMLGAAGPVLGYESTSPAARFVDLSGGLDAARHLAHPLFPFAPSANLMYRRDALLAAGGFDPRYETYEACELHQRLLRTQGGDFRFAPRAVVLHRHRVTWAAYWRQQLRYGRGYGQFLLHHRKEVPWSLGREARAWWRAASQALAACRPGSDDRALGRRGLFVKSCAQRLGCMTTYWNPVERARWHAGALAAKWTPLGLLQRFPRIVHRMSDVPLAVRIGYFIWTLPSDLDRTQLPAVLGRLRTGRRPPATDVGAAVARINRLRQPWMHLGALRGRDTCYMRALSLYRFVDAGPHALRIHFGVEPAEGADRLRGHAWITVDGQVIDPPDPVRDGRVREIYRYPAEG